MRKFSAAILLLLAGLNITPALAQSPPPVPALPDVERRTSYSISGTTCNCNVNFAIFGDSTDYANWIEVFINGALIPQAGNWTISSPTGPLATIPRPITDAVLTFTAVQTGTVQIVGARRPRRVSQFSENRGVAARDLNQAITDLVAMLRENWDKINDVSGRGVFAPPGETLNLLPIKANRLNMGACFDINGNLTSCVNAPSGSFIAGNNIKFTGSNPTTISTTYVRLAKTANYTVANADKGETLALGGSAYFTLTLNAPAGYDSDFCIQIINEDTGRAKSIAASGIATYFLWPGQTDTICNQSNVWRPSLGSRRWLLSAGAQFFVDPTGSDTLNDGLASGASGAFATLQKCVNTSQQYLDTSLFNPNCKMADGGFATGATNGGGGALINGPLVGSGVLTITGNSVTPTNVSIDAGGNAYCIQAQNYAQVIVNYVQCKNAALLFTAPINSAWMQLCGVDVGSTTAGGTQIYVSRQSYLEIVCAVTNSGTSAGYGFQVSHQGNFRATGILTGNTLMTYNANITFSFVNVLVSSGGDFTLTQYPTAATTPWNANGHTITAQKWQVDSGAVYQSIGISGGCVQEPLGTLAGFILGTGSFEQACHQTPTLASCGTVPGILGTDYTGTVTEGSTATGCNLFFQNPFTSAPFCTFTWGSAAPAAVLAATAANHLAITHSSASGSIFTYSCSGF